MVSAKRGCSGPITTSFDPVQHHTEKSALTRSDINAAADGLRGLVVEPAEIADRYILLLAARTLRGADVRIRFVLVVSVRGPPKTKRLVVEYRQSIELRSERRAVKLNVSLRSNVISAVIAGVIYLIIYLATGGGVAGAIIGAVILAVIVFLIAFAFSRLIAPRLR